MGVKVKYIFGTSMGLFTKYEVDDTNNTNNLFTCCRLWRTEIEQKKKEKTLQIQNDLKQGKIRGFF